MYLRRRQRRRGLALMMVLSLLVLFLLMGVSFLMVASTAEKGARAQAKTELRGDDPRKHVEMAMYQLLCGTRRQGTATPISGHSLLGDLYGNDGAMGVVNQIDGTASAQTGGQFIGFTSPLTGPNALVRPWLRESSVNPPSPMPPFLHYLNGRVLTMVSGNAKGLSTRIVESGPINSGQDYYIRVEAFESDDASLPQPVVPAPGDLFVVNGQAFNGSGAGFNPMIVVGQPQYINDRQQPGGGEIALLPNFRFSAGETVANSGGDDESYDAVDYQNMFLAMVAAGATSSQEIIPSYHRPALINYWRNRLAAATPAQQKDAIRQFVLRPTQLDHPEFSGSNPAFSFPISNPPTASQLAQLYDALINANGTTAWDVDNDNDGIPDSIWLDLEFPVITSREGRSVKPLVAILIKDMDGRLNVNSHGNLRQAANSVDVATGQIVQARGDFAVPTNVAPSVQTIPRGRGYGPAEIYFGHALANPTTEWNSLLTARYAEGLPGNPNSNDALSLLKSLRFPQIYTSERNTPYYSPPDIWGIDTQALNFSGQAWSQYGGLPDPTVDEPYELNLFRFNGTEANAIDSPFTVAELERLLRYQDLDAVVMPDRLLNAAPQSFDSFSTTARKRRNLFTTESRHVPVPNTRLDFEQRGLPMTNGADVRKAPHIISWLEAKLRSGGMPVAQVDAQVAYQLPFELLRGKPFNVNRLFGNGKDDNGNGVVDDPLEIDVANELIWEMAGAHPTFRGVRFDHANDQAGVTATTRSRNRQAFARNLYCLMMLLVDEAKGNIVGLPNWKVDRFVSLAESGSLTAVQKRELVARRIAQWAINVVDFRDPDAIMTPFEYDLDPFNANGWDTRIDGNPATNEFVTAGVTDRRIVWGMEYPDLLISEVKAFHDRRVKDTDVDSSGKKRKDGNREGDDDLDQYRLPQGSLFLEFYCPKNRAETDAAAYPKFPAELYSIQNSPLRGGRPTPVLQLGRMAPSGPLGQHPVWRVAISEAHHSGATAPTVNTENEVVRRPDSISFQPEDMSLFGWMNRPTTGVPASDSVEIERYIWFANIDPARTTVPGVSPARIYYNRYANTDLPAGGYAVVGPRLTTHIGSTVEMPVPDLKAVQPQHLPSEQRFELRTTGALYYDRSGAIHPSITAGRTEPALSVIAAASVPTGWQPKSADLGTGIGSGVGISVSEPFPDGYYPTEPTESLFAAGTPFDSWYDQSDPLTMLPDRPFDERAGMPLENLTNTGTTAQFKTAFLQRLADPTLPHNPAPGYPGHDNSFPVNPYITVDWSSIDLTVFSGEENTNRQFNVTNPADVDKWIDPSDEDPYNTGPPELFDTRAKGRTKLAAGTPAPLQDINIWTHTTTTPQNRPQGVGDDYFKIDLRNTMGFLNSTFGSPRDTPAAYRGDPSQPWPWLTWSSRPFDSPLELMNVPASTLSRLPHEFGFQSAANPYGDADHDQLVAPHNHLLNFFDASANQYQSPHFYRIFDYVETPSPFMGAERLYLPSQFVGGAAAEGFRPPYNYLSRFRDPGRINVNTIFEREVWEGIAKGFPDMDPSINATTWNNLLASRQGYGGGFGVLNNAYPTRFANPFRASAQADAAPLPNLRTTGVNATLLRSKPSASSQPLFDFTSNDQHNDTSRNPALRFAGVQRLSNLLTTHSNVFAVWITVGYFEVEQVPVSTVYLSGYRLKQEAGLDSGEVERHRAFYIIDRSIPVAYEPGENHNVDRCVLVRRFIE